MKSIEVRLTISTAKMGESHVSKYETELRMDNETTVGDVAAFAKNCKTIWSKAIAAAKNWENMTDISMEVTSAVYDGWRDPNKPLEQKSFNRWYLRGADDISLEKGEESVYLIPDTRYTNEYWDLLLMKDVLGGLSNV